MYRHRLIQFLLFSLLMGLLLAGCTAVTDTDTAAAPEQESAPVMAAPESLTPQQVTTNFYNWYLDLAGDRADGSFVNPLVSGVYRDSDYLSPAFIAQVDEMSMDGFGFDPFLLAQDVPVSFEVQETTADGATATVGGATATVDVHFYWGGNPEPSLRTVHLIQTDGRWLIDSLSMEMAETAMPAAPETAEGVAAAFYTWYLDYMGDRASDTFRNPLVDQAYHDAPYLTASFIGHVDDLLAEMRAQDMGGYDPFLCAQDIPTEVTPDVAFVRDGAASVVMRSSFPNHMLTVDLRPEGRSWVIGNITCAGNPAGTATAFYTWYLGYIGNCSSEAFRNPLVDKAYQDHPLLDAAFVAEVDALLAEMRAQEAGGYDPFLLAQDVPTNFTVDPGIGENTAVVHLYFGPSSVKHILVTLNQQGRISAIGENTLLPNSDPEADTDSDVALAVYVVDQYAFSFAHPADWVLREEPMGGPGMPDDWPVQANYYLMPQDVADLLASRSGPPDPNAPVIVAPFQIEVVIGDTQAMERVYYDFADGERTAMNNQAVIILRREPGYSHFIFPHPARSDTWIVITDWVTEFPGREAQGATAAPIWPLLLNSMQFNS